jgi:hypothetical protein
MLAPHRENPKIDRRMWLVLRHLPASSACASVSSALSAPAFACPNCATAELVRASVFDEQFWDNLLVICLPLAILGLISALLYRIGLGKPWFRSQR